MLDGEIDQQLEKMRSEQKFYARHIALKKQLAEALQKREAYRYWNYAVSSILSFTRLFILTSRKSWKNYRNVSFSDEF